MKKMVAMMMAALVAFSMVGCGGKKEPDSKEPSESVTPVQEEESSEAPVSSAEEDSTESMPYESGLPENAPALDGPVFDPPLVVIDSDEVYMAITSAGWNGDGFYALYCQMENRSSDKTYEFQVNDATVNGISSSPWFTAAAEPGKTTVDSIEFMDSNLKECGIEDYTDIGLNVRIYEAGDDQKEPIFEDVYHVYPSGEESSEEYGRSDQEGDTVLVDNDVLKMVVTGYDRDSIWGFTAHLYYENKTNDKITINVEDSYVNGAVVDPYYIFSIPADSCAFHDMSWDSDDLADNDITEVDSISFTLQVFTGSDASGECLLEQTVELAP